MQRALAVGAVLLVVTLGACGGSDDGGDTGLPPRSKAAISAPFEDELSDMGLRITRAALVDPETGLPARDATHLAVYVEPTGPYSPEDFTDGVVTVSRVFLPSTFERWPGLTSFDVCQEPLPEVDDSPQPAPKTQIAVSRAEADEFDWAGADLEAYLDRAAAVDDEDFRIYVDREVAATANFRDSAPPAGAISEVGDVSY
jgi:hypothetical protein